MDSNATPRLNFADPFILEFDYVNWKGDPHRYVIKTESLTYGQPDKHWYINGDLITRDGDPREDMGPTRRRSFKVSAILNPRWRPLDDG